MLAIVSVLQAADEIATREVSHALAAALRAHRARRARAGARVRGDLTRCQHVTGVGVVRRCGEHNAVHTAVGCEQRTTGVARAYDGPHRVDLTRHRTTLVDVR